VQHRGDPLSHERVAVQRLMDKTLVKAERDFPNAKVCQNRLARTGKEICAGIASVHSETQYRFILLVGVVE
jgi:hypothetical protein